MEDSAAEERRRHLGVSKFLSKDRWRARDRAGSQEKAQDKPASQLSDDVVDFLKPSTKRLGPSSPKAPRIDIAAAQRWAGKSPELKTGNTISTPSALSGRDNPRRALRRGLNLVVQFAVTVPDIIGEGGDEAELPPIEIGRRRQATKPVFASAAVQQSRSGPVPAQNLAANASPLDGSPSDMHPGFAQGDLASISTFSQWPTQPSLPQPLPGLGDDYVPKPLKRTATGWSDEQEESPAEPGPNSIRIPNPTPPRTNQQRPYDYTPILPRSRASDGDPFVDPQAAVPNSASTQSTTLSYHLPEFESVINNSPIEFISSRTTSGFLEAEPKDRNSLSYQLIHKMRAEEGKAFQEAARNPFADLVDDEPRPSTSTSGSYKAYSPEEGPNVVLPSAQTERLAVSQPQASGGLSGPPSRALTPQMPAPSPLINQYPTPSAQPQPPMPIRKPVAPPQPQMQQPPPSSQQSASQPPTRLPPLPTGQGRKMSQGDYFGAFQSRSEQAAELPPLVIPAHGVQRLQEFDYKTPYTAASLATATSTSAASSANQTAFEDFGERCSHMGGIFRLQAEFERPITEFSPSQWLRCAAWWFLQGRASMEILIRSRPKGQDGRPSSRQGGELLQQPHVDLAKCKWIIMDVIPTHPSVPRTADYSFGYRAAAAREAGDGIIADVLESADLILAHLKALCGSMSRNNVMPPSHALIQGQDQTIWIKYPNISAGVLSIFSGNMSRSLTESTGIRQFSPLSVIGVADTKSDFSYSRIFAKVSLGNQDQSTERLMLPCLVSVMRPRNDWHPKVAICTQKEMITVIITGDRKQGPSWEDVRWGEQNNLLHVKMPHGYSLDVQMTEPDFKQLWNMYNHSYRVQTGLLPREGEKMIYEVALRDFQYTDSRKPPSFPTERIKRSRIRLFNKQETHVNPMGNRTYFRGLRLLVVTSPKNRVLGSVSHDLGTRYPIVVEMTSDAKNEGAPAMNFRVQEEQRQCSLFMVFNEAKDRQTLYRALKDVDPGIDEMRYCSVRLKCLSIEPPGPKATIMPIVGPLADLQWQEVVTVNRDPTNPDHDIGQTIKSSSLRTVAQAADGTITDRINVGPGELKMRLPANGDATITLLRSEQSDLTVILDATGSRATPEALAALHRTIATQQTLRTYTFHNLQDLHTFQKSITGFVPKFDGVCATFTVARRRPVGALSFHKKLEAGAARLQIISNDHDKVVQLLAFFDGFPNCDALGFVLKSVDVFENVDGGGGSSKAGRGRFAVKLVDAKFTLPGVEKDKEKEAAAGQRDITRKFVCLDVPEYPAENDDITIGFDEERERNLFVSVLPAPPQASRGLTLRRKV